MTSWRSAGAALVLIVGIGMGFSAAASLPACGDSSASDGDDPKLPSRKQPGDDASSSSGSIVFVDSGPYVDFDINHVLVTGQSNAVGNGAVNVVSGTQPFTNLMFDTGVMPMKGGFSDPENHASARIEGCDEIGCTTFETPTKLVPLIEGDGYFDYHVETCASSLANEVSQLAVTRNHSNKHDLLVSIHGRSGTTYQCLRKGSCDYKPDYLQPFDQGMKEVTAAKALAAAQNKSYVVRAVVAVHGEDDQVGYTSGSSEFPLAGTDGKPNAIADYGDALVEWQRDYEAGVKEITKQTQPVPLFVTQLSGWTGVAVSKVAQFQLDAHTKAPGKVVLVGPSYPLEIERGDCVHFTSNGVRRMGEYIAKVYETVILQNKMWEPVRPKSISLNGAVITVAFFVPRPPLVLDTSRVAPVANLGFTYVDSANTPVIKNVEATAPDTVQITLASAPTGTNRRLGYAMNQSGTACPGTPTGARGNLRDSDDTPSKDGYELQNWAVNFDLPIP